MIDFKIKQIQKVILMIDYRINLWLDLSLNKLFSTLLINNIMNTL